ncbi:hypothetical protein [Parvicella tangerina]|uniref:Uncharacterized protein n=1 Tax=Parvicella tangerina TaxID=2829795 RepID=A0A916JP34_9FLAO|nr:hypothetical protein [Parvicella tangerina]CAG5084156.1 hypothetical protein CRYO30217_02392 [Parvicella tangerina]
MLILISHFNLNAQDFITQLPEGTFSPEPEEVEDYVEGITIYDLYSSYQQQPLIRNIENGAPAKGKIEDFYSNGFILHKGNYDDGVLTSFTNYYVNGAKERKFKGKKQGEGSLICYFINGYVKEVKNFNDYNVIESENYYNNGVLKEKIVLDEETLIPTLKVTKNNENTIITKIELIDADSLIYSKEVNRVGGGKMAYGRMVLDTNSGVIINEGPYYTYDRDGELTSEVIYAGGNVKEIKMEDREEAAIAYFSYEPGEDNTASSDGVNESFPDEGFEAKNATIIPENFVRFDKDQDAFISNKELDYAVNEFFEDESITLTQINGLVNFFFDQD